MKYFVARLIPIFFFTWFVNLFMLYVGDKYLTYLGPKMEYFFFFSIVVLFIFAVLYVTEDFDRTVIKDVPIFLLKCFVFILPLLYVAISFDQTLGSEAFKRKLTKATSPSGRKLVTPMKEGNKNGEKDLVAVLRNYEYFLGRKIVVSGQIYRGKEAPKGYFFLYQFLVSCCMADARPIAVLVPESDMSRGFEKDSWIKVEGVLEKKIFNGEEAVIFNATSINKTADRTQRNRYNYN